MAHSVDKWSSRKIRHVENFRSTSSQFLMLHLECADARSERIRTYHVRRLGMETPVKLIRSKQQFAFILLAAAAVCGALTTSSAQTAVTPQSMKVIGEVAPRYFSYNVEAVEVTGGNFWAPFKSMPQQPAVAPPSTSANPAVMRDSMLRYLRLSPACSSRSTPSRFCLQRSRARLTSSLWKRSRFQ